MGAVREGNVPVAPHLLVVEVGHQLEGILQHLEAVAQVALLARGRVQGGGERIGRIEGLLRVGLKQKGGGGPLTGPPE